MPPCPTRTHSSVITGAGATAVSGAGTGAALSDGEGVLRRGAPASAPSVESCPLDSARGNRAASATHEDTDGGVANTRAASNLKSDRRLRIASTEAWRSTHKDQGGHVPPNVFESFEYNVRVYLCPPRFKVICISKLFNKRVLST